MSLRLCLFRRNPTKLDSRNRILGRISRFYYNHPSCFISCKRMLKICRAKLFIFLKSLLMCIPCCKFHVDVSQLCFRSLLKSGYFYINQILQSGRSPACLDHTIHCHVNLASFVTSSSVKRARLES